MPFDRAQRDELKSHLTEFSQSVDSILSLTKEDQEGAHHSKAVTAYSRGVRNSSDLNSRRARASALSSFLRGVEYVSTDRHVQDPLSGLPDPHDLMQVTEEEATEDEE